MSMNQGYSLARAELIKLLTARWGITTTDGAGTNDTLVDTNLIGLDQRKIVEKTILICSGDSDTEDAASVSFVPGSGTITVSPAFSHKILAGTIYRIINISTVELDVINILARIGTNTDLAGTTTVFARLRQIVDTYLAHGTIGLAALKALIDAVEGKLDGASGLVAIKAVVDAILVDTGTTLPGLLAAIAGYIDTEVADIKTQTDKLGDATIGLANLKALIDILTGYVDTEVAAILAAVDTEVAAIKTQTDKLAGAAPVAGNTTANWQAAEANVVSIGANDIKNKVHDLSLNISNLAGAVITVRLYKKVNGVERKVYEQSFNSATDPPGLPIINGSWATHDIIRVTLKSNNAADNGKAVDYDYMLEAM